MVASRENQRAFISGPEMQPGFLWKLIGLGVSLVFVLVAYRILSGGLDSVFPRHLFAVESETMDYESLKVESSSAALAGKVDRQSWALLNAISPQDASLPVSGSGLNEQRLELPPLSKSDSFVAIEASKLTSGTIAEKIWGTEEVVRKLAHLLVSMEAGEASINNFAFLNPLGELRVTPKGEGRYVLDDLNFARYDFFVQAVDKVDPGVLVQVFTLLRPLLQEAYGELGYDEGQFDSAVLVALQQLRDTPEINAPVELVRPSVIFKFADPAIEELTSVQKQFIRMGPENSAIVQDKLSQVAQLLMGQTAKEWFAVAGQEPLNI